MKYRSFIIKSVVFIALFVGLDFLMGVFFRFLENKALECSPYGMTTEYTMWRVNSDALIMGASEAQHSFIPSILEKQLGMTVYNCGLDGCRFYYQNAMVNGVLDRYNPKLIIWSISPNELCAPSEEDKGNLSRLNPFYRENDFCKQALKTKSKYESVKLLSNCYSYNSRLFPLLYKVFMPDYQYEYGGYAPLYGTQNNLTKKSKEWYGTYDKEVNSVLKNTIQRCKTNNVQIVFVFTPRFEKESHEDLESYKQLIATVQKYDIPIVQELYHDDDLMKPEFFKDNAHLNNDGATLFSNKLSSIISNILMPVSKQ